MEGTYVEACERGCSKSVGREGVVESEGRLDVEQCGAISVEQHLLWSSM